MTRLCFAALFLASCFAPASADDSQILRSEVNENTAVRFFYNNESNYFHFPLVFRDADSKDARLDTFAPTAEGYTVYILPDEMHRLLQLLGDSDLTWHESKNVDALGNYRKLMPLDHMDITVVTAGGTAKAKLAPKEICATLGRFDTAIKSPRALWEFELFQTGYSCRVRGFRPDAYSQ